MDAALKLAMQNSAEWKKKEHTRLIVIDRHQLTARGRRIERLFVHLLLQFGQSGSRFQRFNADRKHTPQLEQRQQ